MQFTPRSEEELDTRTLLPAGEYAATVTQASEEVSKSSGNEQIHLVLKVKDDQGNQNTVHDYLLEAMGGKLRHFCASAGLMSEYDAGQLTAQDCSGQDVRVRLGIEKGSEKYPDKNVVKDYLSRNGHAPKPAIQPIGAASAEGAAKKAFLVIWNRFVGEFPSESAKRDQNWDKCFTGFFPGKTRTDLKDDDWERFRLAVGKWDPINGWKKTNSPISDEPQFCEDDIPF